MSVEGKKNRVEVEYTLNNVFVSTTVDTGRRLIDQLRETHELGSVKEGCGTGECGACTVLVDGKSMCSCILLVPQIDGKKITTLEGVTTLEGITAGELLHPVQEKFIDEGAVQCGYCTPGMIMSAVELISDNPAPTEDEIRLALSGNLCRCTGYSKIIRAVQAAAEVLRMEGT